MSKPLTIDASGLHLTIRPLLPHELGQLVALTSSVSWQLSLEELKMMLPANPEGFIGAFLDDGSLICHVSLIKQSDSLAYLGLYITSTPYRGRGIGHQIFQYALDMAGSKTVILDSVIGKPEVYAKSGFKLLDIDLIHIYGFVDHAKLVRRNDVDFTVDKITPDNIADVTRFDQQVTLVSRADFLNNWLLSNTSVSLRAVNRAAEVIGYILVRPDHVTKSPNSFKIGGFYANDVTVAHDLICCALDALPQASRVWVEYPSTNEDLSLSMYKALGLEIVLDEWKLMKMAVGGQYPNLDWTKIFAVTNTFNASI